MVRGVNKQTSRYIKETVSHPSHRRRPTGEQYSRRVVETESGVSDSNLWSQHRLGL